MDFYSETIPHAMPPDPNGPAMEQHGESTPRGLCTARKEFCEFERALPRLDQIRFDLVCQQFLDDRMDTMSFDKIAWNNVNRASPAVYPQICERRPTAFAMPFSGAVGTIRMGIIRQVPAEPHGHWPVSFEEYLALYGGHTRQS